MVLFCRRYWPAYSRPFDLYQQVISAFPDIAALIVQHGGIDRKQEPFPVNRHQAARPPNHPMQGYPDAVWWGSGLAPTSIGRKTL